MAKRKKEHYSEVNWLEIVEDFHSGSDFKQKRAKQRACDALKFFIVALMKRKYPTYIEKEGQDLIQSGYLGVIKHLGEYDPEKGAPTTFFDTHIEFEMQEWLNTSKNQSSRYYQTSNNKIQAAIRFFESNAIPYNDIKISERTGLPISTVKNTLAIANKAAALEINEEIKTGNGDETIVPQSFGTPEDEFIAREKNEVLYSCISECLTITESAVLSLIFGLNGSTEVALKDIAAQLGMSVNNVKTTQRKALEKLRNSKLASLIGDKYENSENWLEEDLSFFPTSDNVQTPELQFSDFGPATA